jgi:hypothetical protein
LAQRKKISYILLLSFGLTMAIGLWLQGQLLPENISSSLERKITATHSTSAILNLVRESLEESDSRRTVINSDSQIAEQTYSFFLQAKLNLLQSKQHRFRPSQSFLYLEHRKLLI